MSYDTAFDRLNAKGLITPIGPFGDPPVEKRSANWNPNAHCKYHQGRGHLTENCWKIKETIQDLIDNNKLPLPPASKKPSIDNAPLAHALAISDEEIEVDPSSLIKPVKEIHAIEEDEKIFFDAMDSLPEPASKEDIQ